MQQIIKLELDTQLKQVFKKSLLPNNLRSQSKHIIHNDVGKYLYNLHPTLPDPITFNIDQFGPAGLNELFQEFDLVTLFGFFWCSVKEGY